MFTRLFHVEDLSAEVWSVQRGPASTERLKARSVFNGSSLIPQLLQIASYSD
jgi:hypothetical protein